ncbi:PfkB family carbohydrate kinase [Nocardioides sp. cx-173]|uniref:PfkB family carbohydrate kinase n=1 Tax=Nocardioides sp. cx-173 TaxID=2898796 RepID=UPI001E2D2B86|nr:PfkB family carbohydrate kinase [Nocardioides sp. cx-173]MCD4524038.1 PfkB family carbohydrate kinase [Nocardioides sp. cx-173]UGB41439.1 PfkB family carbohydrate kinase [Nocardioides sp. cx-173]
MPEPGGRVIVVGSAGVDRTALLAQLPAPGETVLTPRLLVGFGGKGSNQAVNATAMGARTAMVVKLGEDADGAAVLDDLRAAGVDTSEAIADAASPTQQAFIWVSADGENSIVVASGATGGLTHDDVAAALSRLAPAAGDVVLTCAEIPRAALEAVPAGIGDGATWVHNAAPAGRLPAWRDRPPILVVNEVEAEQLTGLADVEAAAGVLGASTVATIVTVGAGGALVADGPAIRRVPAPTVEVVDTTGAGDAFCGALAALLVQGRSLPDAVARAVAAGAVAVTALGARGSLATPESVARLLGE